MIILKSIRKVGNSQTFLIDATIPTAATLTKGIGWQWSCYDGHFKSEVFQTKKAAGIHLEGAKTLAELFDLTGIGV